MPTRVFSADDASRPASSSAILQGVLRDELRLRGRHRHRRPQHGRCAHRVRRRPGARPRPEGRRRPAAVPAGHRRRPPRRPGRRAQRRDHRGPARRVGPAHPAHQGQGRPAQRQPLHLPQGGRPGRRRPRPPARRAHHQPAGQRGRRAPAAPRAAQAARDRRQPGLPDRRHPHLSARAGQGVRGAGLPHHPPRHRPGARRGEDRRGRGRRTGTGRGGRHHRQRRRRRLPAHPGVPAARDGGPRSSSASGTACRTTTDARRAPGRTSPVLPWGSGAPRGRGGVVLREGALSPPRRRGACCSAAAGRAPCWRPP